MSAPFQASVQRRWVDLDAQGHANNTLVVEYLQEGRTQLLASGPPEAARLLERGCLVVSNHVEYLRPIPYAEAPLAVEVATSELGGARIVLDYLVRDQGEAAARGRTVLCPYDFQDQSPRRLEPAERAWLARFQSDGAPAWRELPSAPLDGRGVRFALHTRWSDLDAYGHVNNVRLYDYLQEARIAVMGQADPAMARIGTSAWGADGAGTSAGLAPLVWLLARQDAWYLRPVAHRLEPYEVQTACVRLGTSSTTFNAELVDPLEGGAVLARAATVVVAADPSGHPTALPDRVRTALQRTYQA